MEIAFLICSVLRLSLEDLQENSLMIIFLPPQLLFMSKDNQWTLPFWVSLEEYVFDTTENRA